MAKTKKIDKEFCLTDSSVNCYGFRLLTSGYQREVFEKNPIGYYMHDRNDGVVVRWEDFRTEGDKVFAKPVINLSNDRGQQTADEVEDNFLNGASVGHIVALEYSEDPTMMVPGQTGPTITKWYNKECSLVDVPGNMSSLCLFDKDGNAINLADFQIQKNIMKQVILTTAQLATLNLKADVEPSVIDQTLNDLVAKAAKVDTLTTDLATANSAKKKAEDDLAARDKELDNGKVKDLLAAALLDGRTTVALNDKLKVQFDGKPAELKDLLDAMPAYKSIVKDLEDKGHTSFEKMTWGELDKAGKLEDLKAKDFESFKKKFSEAHNGAEWGK